MGHDVFDLIEILSICSGLTDFGDLDIVCQCLTKHGLRHWAIWRMDIARLRGRSLHHQHDQARKRQRWPRGERADGYHEPLVKSCSHYLEYLNVQIAGH